MKRAIAGLRNAATKPETVGEGFYLVRVRQATLRESGGKAFLALELLVLQPAASADRTIRTRLYCTPRALWKLQWFLQDFAYDLQLMAADELEDKALRNLKGVVKVSHHDLGGRILVNLDGFAPALNWRSQFQLAEAG